MKSIKLLSLAVVPVGIAGAIYFTQPAKVVDKSSSGFPKYKNTAIASNPDRNAYFGDLHLHTAFSFDAYVMMGTRAVPEQAYKFAKGETITLNGEQIKRSYPLDFMAVTDHSENLGLFQTLEDPDSDFSNTDFGKEVKSKLAPVGQRVPNIKLILELKEKKEYQGIKADGIIRSQWQKEIQAANSNYEPGKFTTFIGYEWTSHTNLNNLHRNVIFRNNAPAKPFSSLDSDKPEDLWKALNNFRKQGFEALAISHNANVSNGLMYDWKDSYGNEIDEAYAQQRALNEPLSEISQSKGQSETQPQVSPNDEFSNFEVVNYLLAGEKIKGKVDGSYIRQAYGRGLEIEKKIGKNPYKFGVIGSTDIHSGLSTSTEKEVKGVTFGNLDYGSGSIAGVWAEENTRESIYDALRRKETFATSGPRLKFRFFAGWDFDTKIFTKENWVKEAYAKGVPMGADLPQKSNGSKAPTFIVWAVKDPDGANLDRAQIVKVWLKDGKYQEKVFDVALSDGRKVSANGKAPTVGNTVDLKTGNYSNTIGDTELKAIWQDPGFNPSQPAVYYLRVIEIPTPRYSTILAVKAGSPIPEGVPATIQERGWASPIWYNPK